jgi:hypothetical protein
MLCYYAVSLCLVSDFIYYYDECRNAECRSAFFRASLLFRSKAKPLMVTLSLIRLQKLIKIRQLKLISPKLRWRIKKKGFDLATLTMLARCRLLSPGDSWTGDTSYRSPKCPRRSKNRRWSGPTMSWKKILTFSKKISTYLIMKLIHTADENVKA